ncbi:hypothetical protein [Alkalinema sp. FACHB-956]|uniref:hypothetical protein n=1 Tax=Alkalinema sp. FACHB-956 TaxID=2692768 RepID=UPI0016860A37|nr:hypothetical protein [Alkalinema sp. FACHB-956]MBD2326092.1 hypothetical protein [Alkalinema sp. FACHB-956]
MKTIAPADGSLTVPLGALGQTWRKPKRKRGKNIGKSWRRMRLYWNSLDRELQQQHIHWKKRPRKHWKRISVKWLKPLQ